MAEAHEILFAEATRLIARQEANLDTLRVRSLGVLSAGGLIAGIGALSSHHHGPWTAVVALIALAGIIGAAIWIQWPASFDFSHDLGPMLAQIATPPDDGRLTTLDVTYSLGNSLNKLRHGNTEKIKNRHLGLATMCALLGVEALAVVVSQV